MAGKRPQSAKSSSKVYFASYPTVSEKRRRRRVERHLKAFPEDLQTKRSLAKGLAHRGGKKPSGNGLALPVRVVDSKTSEVHIEYRKVGGKLRPHQMDILKREAFAKKIANERRHLSTKKREESKDFTNLHISKLEELKRKSFGENKPKKRA